MSNVNSAKQVIESELSHAKQGAAYYAARATMLEEVLDAIERADSTPRHGGAKPGIRQASSGVPTGRRGGKRAGAKDAGLPSTGKGFWPGLITAAPQSAAQILEAAIKALGISPTEEQLKKLMQRETNALHTLVKNGEIQDSGSGRSRRFFRKD